MAVKWLKTVRKKKGFLKNHLIRKVRRINTNKRLTNIYSTYAQKHLFDIQVEQKVYLRTEGKSKYCKSPHIRFLVLRKRLGLLECMTMCKSQNKLLVQVKSYYILYTFYTTNTRKQISTPHYYAKVQQ